MRPLRYSINVTLDGCCDHRAIPADEDLHGHAVENLNQADALLFGRVTYEMMESAWRPPMPTGARPDWMEPFAQTINAQRSTLFEHPGAGRLERGTRARGSGQGRPATQAGVGQGTVRGRCESCHWRGAAIRAEKVAIGLTRRSRGPASGQDATGAAWRPRQLDRRSAVKAPSTSRTGSSHVQACPDWEARVTVVKGSFGGTWWPGRQLSVWARCAGNVTGRYGLPGGYRGR